MCIYADSLLICTAVHHQMENIDKMTMNITLGHWVFVTFSCSPVGYHCNQICIDLTIHFLRKRTLKNFIKPACIYKHNKNATEGGVTPARVKSHKPNLDLK